MKLHNRQIKSDFWTDSDILKLKRDIRLFYIGLWQIAEDSGCLEDDPFTIKIILFPSPSDNDITIETINSFIETLVKLGKLVRYEVDGKKYLFIKNFHKHQKINPAQRPTIPLPDFISFEPFPSNDRVGKYKIAYKRLTEYLQTTSNIKENKIIENNIKELDLSWDDNQDVRREKIIRMVNYLAEKMSYK
ncbi:MAG: hypothetical protein ABDH34_08340 [Dictyoglomus thermophilum]